MVLYYTQSSPLMTFTEMPLEPPLESGTTFQYKACHVTLQTFRANLGTKLGNAVFGEEQAMMTTEAVLRISRWIGGSGKRLSNNCHPGK